jgi:hypothetical protein
MTNESPNAQSSHENPTDCNLLVANDDHFVNQIEHFSNSHHLATCNYANQCCCDKLQECNVSHIGQCIRLIVHRKLSGKMDNGNIDVNKIIMDNYVKSMWSRSMESSENPLLIEKNSEHFNHRAGIYCIIDAIAMLNTEKVAFNFFYVDYPDLLHIQQHGPFKKDVVSMVASLHLSDLYHGIIIYEHCDFKLDYAKNGTKNNLKTFFHIKRRDEIYDAITKRGLKIKRYISQNKLPDKCCDFDKKSCKHLCDN